MQDLKMLGAIGLLSVATYLLIALCGRLSEGKR